MTDKIYGIRARLVDHDGSFLQTKICDKGLYMNQSDDAKYQVSSGEWFAEAEIKPKKLVVEVNLHEPPMFAKKLVEIMSAKDEAIILKDGHGLSDAVAANFWQKKFISVTIDFQLGFYFIDSLGYHKVSDAQKGWIDLTQFVDVVERKQERLELKEGEQLQLSEFRMVLSSLAFQADVAGECFAGFYSGIPSDKRAEALNKLKEALAILNKY